jgi:hypothetical protein
VDGGVDNGPFWEALTAFAEEPSFYIANDAGSLVCGPMAAEAVHGNWRWREPEAAGRLHTSRS